MASSTVPTLKLDGRNWKVFQASLLEAAATKGWLGILSGQETNDETTKFRDPTPISIPTEKPIEAPNDDKTQESCTKPNELSVEPPSEERLEDGLTKFEEYIPEVPSNLCTAWNELYEQPNSRAGGPLESKHIKVLNGMVEVPDKVENVNKMAHEDLPSKPCNRSTTNDLPSVRELPLEGEQALCMSPRNLHGIEDELTSSTTNSQSSTLEQPTAHNWAAENEGRLSLPARHEDEASSCMRQHIPKAQRVPLEGELADCTSDCAGSMSSDKRNLRGCANTSRAPAGNISRRQEDEEAYQSCNNAIPHPRKGIGTPKNLTVEYRTLKECPEGIRSWHSVNMNPPSQTRGPGGQVKVNEMFRDIEDEWKHQNDQEQVGMDGKWCQMDGATSSTCHDSKRVETRLLTGDKGSGQHKWQKHKPIDVPEPPTPLGIHLGRPTKPVNEPR
ncbi:hypothetical protein F5141DRAFT_1065429 [Pisolithus sp. B1]|nr:hypothetical protein F5141DRAFT_1065429 [Pisolithus sp. B1]